MKTTYLPQTHNRSLLMKLDTGSVSLCWRGGTPPSGYRWKVPERRGSTGWVSLESAGRRGGAGWKSEVGGVGAKRNVEGGRSRQR
ncbi:unnamed protein product [Lactuca virosa]|uniref:Uncharacterized protein n=1 Tax=Lactuca virosa TaxID=75947 RepID=A0AAU9M437_9ASTR|nr:unnamed protein product [Lactuca virosa]